VASTTASPDSIQYSLQANFKEKIRPRILKVDPEFGRVLWKLESTGNDCVISDKFVYVTRVSQVTAWLKLEEGPETHYTIRLINPSNGEEIWSHQQSNRQVVKTEAQKNWVMTQFDDGVEVLKFFSL
jgi:hypothetical protein